MVVDDLQFCCLAGELLDVEGMRAHLVVVATGGCAYRLTVEQQVDAGFALMRTAANEEGDEFAVDSEGVAGHGAGVGVGGGDVFVLAGVVRVDQPFALGADLALVAGHFFGDYWLVAESCAGGCPVLIGILFEVFENDVGPFLRLSLTGLLGGARQGGELTVRIYSVAAGAGYFALGIKADCVLQPAEQFDVGPGGAGVFHRVLHGDGGQAGIVGV